MSSKVQDVYSYTQDKKTGSEAAIHAMQEIFKESQIEAIILVDAENAFNAIYKCHL